MSKGCEVVEWGFANILSQWSFLDFRTGMKVLLKPVAKCNIVGAFLLHLQTSFYGNQIMVYFDYEILSLDQCLLLINK